MLQAWVRRVEDLTRGVLQGGGAVTGGGMRRGVEGGMSKVTGVVIWVGGVM